MSKALRLMLAPTPDAKPEFLATVEAVENGEEVMKELGGTPVMILNEYSRDKWAAVGDMSQAWINVWFKSTDGRGKLPGFLKYLKDRKKASVGKFKKKAGGNVVLQGVFVVPFEQSSKRPPGDVIFCKFAFDQGGAAAAAAPNKGAPPVGAQAVASKPPARKPQTPPPATKSKRAGGGAGKLGNLLGAQQRTNTHLSIVPGNKRKAVAVPPPTTAATTTATTTTTTTTSGDASAASAATGSNDDDDDGVGESLTSGQAVAKFRQEMELKLSDFRDDDDENVCKVSVSLAKIIALVLPEEKTEVTMEMLKYVVTEQAEEIGEDMWIVHREPSEFADEIVMAVYKSEDVAPQEALDELNKADLPDELLGQHRAIAEAEQKKLAQKERKQDEERMQQSIRRMGSALGDKRDLTAKGKEEKDDSNVKRPRH